MSQPSIKGWCPGAHQPMMSGDGLVVRVRPHAAHLSRAQALGLCEAAVHYGSGVIDLTNRANLQIRGVSPGDHAPLLESLLALDLLDPDPATEVRRTILVTPFYDARDAAHELSQALVERLMELPPLPGKFGFVVDTGPRRELADCSGDIRLERGKDGGLILRADGAETGRAVDLGNAIDAVIALANWFADTADSGVKRMKTLLQNCALPKRWRGASPAPRAPARTPGPSGDGFLYGVPFGQIEAEALRDFLDQSGAQSLRVTPWRMILLDRASTPVQHSGFITTPDDPLARADACPGAPYCPQAQIETRGIARQLAARIPGTLHVSGCAKGCARTTAADITLVGRNVRIDLVKQGRTGDEPAQRGLTPETLLEMKF